jgi:hypothetical protein
MPGLHKRLHIWAQETYIFIQRLYLERVNKLNQQSTIRVVLIKIYEIVRIAFFYTYSKWLVSTLKLKSIKYGTLIQLVEVVCLQLM